MAPTTSRGLQHNKPWGNYNPGLAQGREGPLSLTPAFETKNVPPHSAWVHDILYLM